MARVNILNFTHVAEICEKSEYQLKYHQGKMKIATEEYAEHQAR